VLSFWFCREESAHLMEKNRRGHSPFSVLEYLYFLKAVLSNQVWHILFPIFAQKDEICWSEENFHLCFWSSSIFFHQVSTFFSAKSKRQHLLIREFSVYNNILSSLFIVRLIIVHLSFITYFYIFIWIK
jgi:hypothetical protein